MEAITCSMYHVIPFDNVIRKDFMFPSWPYANGVYDDPPKDTLDYFQKLGIIRYQDTANHPMAHVLDLIDGSNPMRNGPIDAFRSIVDLDEDTWEPLKFGKGDFFKSTVSWEQHLEHFGDMYRWRAFNVPVKILKMDNKVVRLGKRDVKK